VYQKAMFIEETKQGLLVETEVPISVNYDGKVIGEFYADQVVERLVIVEFKAVKSLLPEHEAQLLNYLNATNREVGLLFNFGSTPEFKRKVYDNEKKRYRNQPDGISGFTNSKKIRFHPLA
jgi:GxxExxY protein